MADFEERVKKDPKLVTDKRSKQKRKEIEAAASRPDAPSTVTKANTKRTKTLNGSTKRSSSKNSSQSVANGRSGFDDGLTAEDIIGATDSSGHLMYLIKW